MKETEQLEVVRGCCLFLVDLTVRPLLACTTADVRKKIKNKNKNATMGYILGNMPKKYQHVLEHCKSSLEMVQTLDRTIHPVYNSFMNAVQIEVMNIYYDPTKESAIEFRVRAQCMISEIRRNPGEELTEKQIKWNVLGDIAGGYPKIHEDAVEDLTYHHNGKYFREDGQRI